MGEGNYFSPVNKIFAPRKYSQVRLVIVAAGNYFWPGFTTLQRISRHSTNIQGTQPGCGRCRFRSLWGGGFESSPWEVTIISTLLCREGWSEREWFQQPEVWPATFLTWAMWPSAAHELQGSWDAVPNQAGGLVWPQRLNQTTFTFNHHLFSPCRRKVGLTFPPTFSQRNQCLIAVFDFLLILFKLKLRGYRPPSQNPYSSWKRSGSDLWDIK